MMVAVSGEASIDYPVFTPSMGFADVLCRGLCHVLVFGRRRLLALVMEFVWMLCSAYVEDEVEIGCSVLVGR